MKAVLTLLVCFPLASTLLHGGGNPWKPLSFDPQFSAWRQPTQHWFIAESAGLDPTKSRMLQTKSATGGIAINGPEGKENDLVTCEEFGDCEVHVEFMVARKSNSGVYVMGSYEVQIYDSFAVAKDQYPGIECGGIYPQWIDNRNQNGHSPASNASKPCGEWQSFDITFHAPRFDAAGKKSANAKFIKVVHNGTTIQENVDLPGPTRSGDEKEKSMGPLRLQGDHGPVAYRNVRIRPLGNQSNRFFPFCIDWHDSKKRDFTRQAEMLKELGYEGVGHLWLDKVEERIKTLDAAGLRLFQISMKLDLAPGKLPYDRSRFKDVCDLVKGRNVQFCLLLGGLKPSDPSFDPQVVEMLREMADAALDSGSQLLIYPHKDDWVERIEDAVRVANKVDRPNVGVMFNLCHWLHVDAGRDYKPLLQHAMPRLWAVSINGADERSDPPDWPHYIRPLDEGSFDIGKFLKTLEELGYQGPIGLQCYGITGDVRVHLERSMKTWRKLHGVE